MFANRVLDVVVINGIHDDVYIEDGVARSIWIGGFYRFAVDEGRIFPEYLIGLAVPPRSLFVVSTRDKVVLLATVYINRGVIRIGDGQVQTVVFFDITFIIECSIRVGTRSIEGVIGHAGARMFPYVRIFLVLRSLIQCVRDTDGLADRFFYYEVQYLDGETTVIRIGRVAVSTGLGQGFFSEFIRTALRNDNGLMTLLNGGYVNLVEDGTVALGCLIDTVIYRVAVHRIGRHTRRTVGLQLVVDI